MNRQVVSYRHRQTGWVVILALAVPIGLVIVLPEVGPSFHIVFAGAFLLLLALFHSLTVEVTPERVQLRFGVGLIRKSIRLDRIRAHRVVRNPWYYGWGIHWFPGGVVYNVSGMWAVELDLDNGRRFRIGTDEPEALAASLARALG